jgi:hypothetical protein
MHTRSNVKPQLRVTVVISISLVGHVADIRNGDKVWSIVGMTTGRQTPKYL